MQNFDGKHEDISVVCTLQQRCAKRDDLFIQLQLLKNTENAVTLSLKTQTSTPLPIPKFASEQFPCGADVHKTWIHDGVKRDYKFKF